MEPDTRRMIDVGGGLIEDRRSEPRHRVFKGGKLSFNCGYGALECVVRNLSPRGARLHFGDTSAVPQHFDLRLSDEGHVRPARVCWRTMTAIGVAFEREDVEATASV